MTAMTTDTEYDTSAPAPSAALAGASVVTRASEWEARPLPQVGEFPPLIALLGAHGGAGTSTLERLWAPAVDTHRLWPANPATTQRVFVVAREHMAGIAAAAEMLRAAEARQVPEGVRVCGLITVAAHPGRTHRAVARYTSTVAELAPHTYRIPWLGELIPLLHKQLPQWRPADGAKFTRRSERGELATVPGSVASIGQQICADLVADETASTSPS